MPDAHIPDKDCATQRRFGSSNERPWAAMAQRPFSNLDDQCVDYEAVGALLDQILQLTNQSNTTPDLEQLCRHLEGGSELLERFLQMQEEARRRGPQWN